MHTLRFSLLITVALLGITSADTAEFVQDRFAIGLWVDPPLDERADARYQELADANFTMVIGGFGRNEISKLVALCERHDLRLIAPARGVEPGALPDSPVVWGYGIRDEPSADDFPALAETAAAIRAARPGKMAYVNLFPNYASASQLGTATYEEHVSQFIKIFRPEVLSMDHYPIFHPDRDGRAGYCENLDVFRKHALAADIPFWNFFNTMPYGPHTPTPRRVSFAGRSTPHLPTARRGSCISAITRPPVASFRRVGPSSGAMTGPRGTTTRPGASTGRLRTWGPR